jgi:hypothetical protein
VSYFKLVLIIIGTSLKRYIIPDAGHSMSEIGIAKKLVEITNRLR